MEWESAFLWFVTLIISLTVHEAAHALFAKLGGDPTAYRLGQVTLNPLPHMQREPIGMVVLPLVSLVASHGNSCIGFASTPIDPVWAYHHPRRAALMSAAGPLANLLLAAIAFTALAIWGKSTSNTGLSVTRIALVFLALNLLLFVFNLIPLPPLDGAGVVEGLAPGTRGAFEFMRRQPLVPLITLIVAIKIVPLVFDPLFDTVIGWLRALHR